jgi:phenylacetic acid degradation operon negative regulatory protein
MNARAALFDLYGDHLRERGGQAPVAALITILSALDVAAPAVRTAVSRMVRQGWLQPVRDVDGAVYALTPRAHQRLDAAAARIYGRSRPEPWDGRWSVLVLARTTDRARRDRVQRALSYLGYRPLSAEAWVAPYRSDEVADVLGREGLRHDEFLARLCGDDAALADRLYDLDGLAAAYEQWLHGARALAAPAGGADPRTAFAVRSRLVHEWRKFLFRDPGLPPALLPEQWPGRVAAAHFHAEADRLLPAARTFIDACLPGRTA